MTSESRAQRRIISEEESPCPGPNRSAGRLSLLPELTQTLESMAPGLGLLWGAPRTHHMLSSVRSSRVRPKESTYLSTLRLPSVSWAELKLDTTRVAIPKHLRTEEQEAPEALGAGRDPGLGRGAM